MNYKFSTRKQQVKYMIDDVYIKLFWIKQQQNNSEYNVTTCTELVVFLYWTLNSTNNLSSYFGVIDARMSASDKE